MKHSKKKNFRRDFYSIYSNLYFSIFQSNLFKIDQTSFILPMENMLVFLLNISCWLKVDL